MPGFQNAICDFAISLQKPDGSFKTGPNSEITYLHPHLYACEGLIYSGVFQSNEKHLKSGIARHNLGCKATKQ